MFMHILVGRSNSDITLIYFAGYGKYVLDTELNLYNISDEKG